MLRPLAIGLPIILAIVAAFVIGMNTVPFSSPYFPYVIGGYVVLFPLALLFTIIGTVRSARRAMAGGDASLQQRGRRATATVTAVKPSTMTMRVSGSPPMRAHYVTLKVEDIGAAPYEVKTTRTVGAWDAGPAVGTRVPVFIDPANPQNLFVVWAEAGTGAVTKFGAADGSVNVQTMVIDGRQADLSQLPAGLQDLLKMGLNIAEKYRAGHSVDIPGVTVNIGGVSGPAPASGDAEVPHTTVGHGVVRPAEAGPVREEGRARIESLQPNPDGTYELDLFVTPKTRASYRLTVAMPVPPEHADKMRRGQYLSALLDPASPETIEIDWDKS